MTSEQNAKLLDAYRFLAQEARAVVAAGPDSLAVRLEAARRLARALYQVDRVLAEIDGLPAPEYPKQ